MASSRAAELRDYTHQTQSYNLRCFKKNPLAEVSGSLGDLGTLLPLMIALTLRGSISLPATLLFTGLSNILTGVAFGLPLPVQPMKAIAAVALAKHFSMKTMTASGIVMGGIITLFSVLGLLRWAQRVVPTAVVRGIQVGAGLSLCISSSGGTLMGALGPVSPWWGDNYIWASAAALVLLCSIPFPRFPYALVVFLVGLLLAIIRVHTDGSVADKPLPARAVRFGIVIPNGENFVEGTFSAALGQLPLTILNSIIAVVALAEVLQPTRPTPSTTAIGVSVGIMNLIAPWFGGMPACHGSGGLAAQYRFGARSGSSVIFLGVIKMILGVVSFFKGHALARLLGEFPHSILGVMVIAAGIELARAGISLNDTPPESDDADENGDADYHAPRATAGSTLSDGEKSDRWMVLLVTVAGMLAFKNDFVGFVAGLLWHWGLIFARRYEKNSSRGGSFWTRLSSGTEDGSRGESATSLLS